MHPCAGCGCSIPRGGLFYRCRTEIISGFDHYIPESEADGERLIREAGESLAGRSPAELEAEVYEEISFLVCPACRQKLRQQLLAMQARKAKAEKILLFRPA